MLNITENTKIYVVCPASFQTGGTEALHVLAFELRNLGLNANMTYINIKEGENPVGERFQRFNVPYVQNIVDNEENVLVVPEVQTKILNEFSNIQKAFWWLSVDNYLTNLKPEKEYKGLKKIFRAIFPNEKSKKKPPIDFNDENILHLAQSAYAMDFITKHGAKNKAMLADYLGSEFFERTPDLTSETRKNIVLYNPKKGIEFTKSLIEYAKDIKFIPLENMTPAQVRDLCLKSKIYIDFGEHPGKDRFPREAAIQGNIIITGEKGAAGYFEDVPIPAEYKFNDISSEYENITKLIKFCLENYDEKIKEFESYRQFINDDKETFISNLKAIFKIPEKI